jgi:hypothetical protein
MTDDRFANPTEQHLRHHGAGGLVLVRAAGYQGAWHTEDHGACGAALDYTGRHRHRACRL